MTNTEIITRIPAEQRAAQYIAVPYFLRDNTTGKVTINKNWDRDINTSRLKSISGHKEIKA